MIIGYVTPDQLAVIRFQAQGQTGFTEEIEAIVDTGFSGFLTLPLAIIARLNLAFRGLAQVTLADGADVQLNIYRIDVLWHGAWRSFEVLEASSGPLVGMALLHGYKVEIEVTDGGSVIIEALH